MLHPDTEIRPGAHGLGIYVTHFIPKGTVTWARDRFDQGYSEAEVATMSDSARSVLSRWSYVSDHGERILQWDGAKYHNHSCEPTTGNTDFWHGDADIATRDLYPGDQLTNDYRAFSNPRYDKSLDFDCECGASDCCGRVTNVSMPYVSETLARLSREAVALIDSVPQPIINALREPFQPQDHG